MVIPDWTDEDDVAIAAGVTSKVREEVTTLFDVYWNVRGKVESIGTRSVIPI